MAHTRRARENSRQHTESEREWESGKTTEKQKNNMQMRLCSILLSAESKVQAKVKLKVNVLMSLQLLQMFVIIMHAAGVG